MPHNSFTSNESMHALAYATFIISSDGTAPEVWTDYFEVSPSRTITKGQPYVLPSGRLSDRPGKLDLWALESKSAVQSDQLEPHLRYLVERLALPRIGLRELVERAGARMRFFCYWFNEMGDRIPDVPEDVRVMINALGGIIEIGEYR
ncbi:hypothetical protein WK53_10815 [Burkholderia ubonensis]|uniref:DUF4279 domain-containing protein n=2 Tax=Burkholderia ubonensis TaxID=101571 RepID=A0AAW3N9L8_9BURK|nr:DUF4279 domain-containing protein [Burkholderia ubonensis]KVT50354.1 hypothetical protein WK53_10815 [Burkholderia ubonensis]